MRWFGVFAALIGFTLLVWRPLAGGDRFGIAIVPSMEKGADDTERLIYEYLGGHPDVDKMYVPDDATDLLQTLVRLGRTRPMDRLIIAGHGAKDNPSVLLKKGTLLPRDVDMDLQCQELWTYRRAAQKKIEEGLDASVPQQEVKKREERIKLLRDLQNVMAKDGHITLLNCSSYASDKGKQWVKNLGKLLLSNRGGTIQASKVDIGIGQVEDYLDMIYGYATRSDNRGAADYWVKGDWEILRIGARGPQSGEPCPEPRPAGAGKLLLLPETSFEVWEPNGKTFVEGKVGTTPTSRWEVGEDAFHFHSTKDGFDLQINWLPPPDEIGAFDSFDFKIQVKTTGGPRPVEIGFSPVIDMAAWRVELTDGKGAANAGVNSFLLKLGSDKGPPAPQEAFMNLKVTPVGRGASVKAGKVEGGTGKFFSGAKPDKWDSFHLQISCNGLANAVWSFVPVGSPLLKTNNK